MNAFSRFAASLLGVVAGAAIIDSIRNTASAQAQSPYYTGHGVGGLKAKPPRRVRYVYVASSRKKKTRSTGKRTVAARGATRGEKPTRRAVAA